ncbi:hypothetical protein E4T56_gene9484, partial [Termitomyces sp. T112]
VALVFNTTEGWQSLKDSQSIRQAALGNKVPYFTTAAGSVAAVEAIGALRSASLEVQTPAFSSKCGDEPLTVPAEGRAMKAVSRLASIEKLPMLAIGYEKLTDELKALREERPRIVDAIEEARAHGDLSENAECQSVKERQGEVEAPIADLVD